MPAVSLANLANYSLQLAAVIVVGVGGMWAVRLGSPRLRLACLRVILAACLVLPFTAAVPPAQPPALAQSQSNLFETTVAGLGPGAASVEATGATTTARQAEGPSPWIPRLSAAAIRVLPFVLLAGIIGRLLWLGIGLVALGRLRRRAVLLTTVNPRRGPRSVLGPVGGQASPAASATRPIADAAALVGASADFLMSGAAARPVTFGAFRPVVLLPETFAALDEAEQVAIATHELLHVRRRDWLQTIGEELLRATFWFHPAMWWLLGQIDLGREQVVDRDVVALTERREPYVNALVRLALSPAGPVLRPASLLLGRAHLLTRVALLSREVRMSRWRLAVSVALVAAAVGLCGHLVVQAFPLTAAVGDATARPDSSGASVAPAVATDMGAAAAPAEPPRQAQPSNRAPRVLQSFPPNLAPGNVESGRDAIVAIAAKVGASGLADGAITLVADKGRAQAAASDPAAASRMIDERSVPAAVAAQMRAALDALGSWRFEAAPTPADVYIGFNFAADQAGSVEPVRVGGAVRQPAKIKDVRPLYPEDAQNRGIQGVVIIELLIDGNTGIPAQAVALRPVGPLTIPALEAALQWRFAPTPEFPRLLMTITVNFTLGGVAGGVAGGTQGGVSGGIAGGVAGGTQLSIPEGWPAPIRVGGNIKAPTKTLDVRPVYPPLAQQARVQGVVIAEVLIGPDGRVADARILRSIPLLDQAALDAVRQWQFTPTLLNGNPIPIIMTTTVNFSLDGNPKGGVLEGASGGGLGGVGGGVRSGVAGGVAGGVATGAVSSPWPANAIRVGGEIKPPTKTLDVRPVYPPLAEQARVQGVVIVEALIGPDGKVADARILRSIPLLDQAALEAVRQWQFTPTLLNGNPIPIIMTCTVNFTLEGPRPGPGSEVVAQGAPAAGLAPVVPERGASPLFRPGPGVTAPTVLSEQKPSYEPTAYQEKVQGTVVVEAVVGTDGTVQHVNVIKPLDARLDQKAIEAAYKWRFAPGTKNGAAVPVLVTIELTFKLA